MIHIFVLGSCDPILLYYISKTFPMVKKTSNLLLIERPNLEPWKFEIIWDFKVPKWECNWEYWGSFFACPKFPFHQGNVFGIDLVYALGTFQPIPLGCKRKARAMTIMGWILEPTPNTPWISNLITMVIEIEYLILTYNYGKRNPNDLLYVTIVLFFLKKKNHPKGVKSLLGLYATWWFYDFDFFFKYMDPITIWFWKF